MIFQLAGQPPQHPMPALHIDHEGMVGVVPHLHDMHSHAALVIHAWHAWDSAAVIGSLGKQRSDTHLSEHVNIISPIG